MGQVGAVPAVPRPMYGWMLDIVGVAFGVAFDSIAQFSFALSICRRLLMHAVFSAVTRACMKLGMAIVASRPMMATTIMISINVKPVLG